MTDADRAVRSAIAGLHEDLFALLRIPSISTDPAHRADVRRTAEWIAARAGRAGLRSTVEETAGHPVVIARHDAGSGAPTLLVYGHYDVQPADPLDAWSSPPFEPCVRGDRLFARGAADDKAQVLLQIAAAELAVARGELPLNLILLLEGEEEIGSPSLGEFVRDRRQSLAADHILIADSMMFGPDRPSLIFGMRGMVYLEVELRSAAHDLHSGQYGGAVANPANALAAVLASLHDANRRVSVDGFYDDIVPPARAVLDGWSRLPFDAAAFRAGAGDAVPSGEEGFSTLERLWIRPTLDVNGLLSGYTGPGKKTVLPATAVAKLSCRLVPDQDPARIADLIRDHVLRATPPDVRAEVRLLQCSRPWREDPTALLYVAAGHALEAVFGNPAALVAHGGSLPIAPVLRDTLGAPVAVMGFALPGANMHGPDEWFPLDHFEKGIRTMMRLYAGLGPR
jgi:acetylornithine deacetylase/succinyl-diaminopimelate desuccinylase-like protein